MTEKDALQERNGRLGGSSKHMNRKVLTVTVVAILLMMSATGLSLNSDPTQKRTPTGWDMNKSSEWVLSDALYSTPNVAKNRTATVWINVNELAYRAANKSDKWGSFETFSGAPNGTRNHWHNVSLAQSRNSESIILGGSVWVVIIGNVTNQMLLGYAPTPQGGNWVVSFETYAPKQKDGWKSTQPHHIGLTSALLGTNGRSIAPIDLSYGSLNSAYMSINGTRVADKLLDPRPNNGAAHGTLPDRYLVSYAKNGTDMICSVREMASGIVYSRHVIVPVGWSFSQLILSSTSTVLKIRNPGVPTYSFTFARSWVIDNLGCRGLSAPYPLIAPSYEYVYTNSPSPSLHGLSGANVTIDGKQAQFNASTGNYEVNVPYALGWAMAHRYSVLDNGVYVNGTVAVTMLSSTANAYLPKWYNGLDFVTVFGVDDCNGPIMAMQMYATYNVPVTAYCFGPGGSSKDILATGSEIALHYPHYWWSGNIAFWSDSLNRASLGMTFLRSNYSFASKWDNPAYVGNGSTFISMAWPGNQATPELMQALYGTGIRIAGRAADLGAPSNRILTGSWYNGTEYPYQPIYLMDANRGLCWDHYQNWNSLMSFASGIAQGGGVIRIYGHPWHSIQIPAFVHWLADKKTNYTYENWLATDGEVASYVYGHFTTSIKCDGLSNNTETFTVNRADPRQAGYWLVPITVGIDVSGRTVQEVVITDNSHTYRMSDGTLKNLDGKRILGTGYSITDGTLYLTQFWNSSATIKVVFAGAPISLQLSIRPGWNLISVPLVNTNYEASTLGLRAGDMVAGWNSTSGAYDKVYIPGVSTPSWDFAIEPNVGYWVHAGAAQTLQLSGNIATAVQNLAVTVPAGGGWTLVGFCSFNWTMNASGMQTMFFGGRVVMIAAWSTSSHTYSAYIAGISSSTADFALVPRQGYWIFTNVSGTLSYRPHH